MDPFDAAVYVLNGGRPDIPESVPFVCEALIKGCWAQSPESRPRFQEVVKAMEEFERTGKWTTLRYSQSSGGCCAVM